MGDLYSEDLLRLAEGDSRPDFDDTAFFDAAGMVYNAGGFDASMLSTPEARKMIDETLRILKTGIDSGLPVDVPEVLRYALENNAFIFSGFKAFHTLREVGLSLLTDKGEIKPFETFRHDVETVHKRYNHNYLYAEYNHAVGSSLMAARWHQIEADGDRYDLQYRTAQDDRVREDHAILHGTTLPPSDPFWGKYMPPNGWNCRCTAVQVRKGKYPLSDPALSMQKGDNCTEAAKQQIFRFNPGKELQLFPPKHPYFKAPEATKKIVAQLSEEQKREQRITEIIAELPAHLTEVEKQALAKHCLKLEKDLGITKGKPMSVDEADKQSANPNFSKARTYQINCQTCAPAYVLRLLGFDVVAKANTKGSLSEYLSRQHTFEAWLKPDGTAPKASLTYDWMIGKGYKQMSKKRYEEYFKECCKETGVYILTIGWKGGGGHATILQRFEDGSLSYIEPQIYNGKSSKRSIDELCESGALKPVKTRGVMRVDNLLFNQKFASIFEKSSK